MVTSTWTLANPLVPPVTIAVPAPKLVIVLGACGILDGPLVYHVKVGNGAQSVLPVDRFIPGCPPHPVTILDRILRLLDRR